MTPKSQANKDQYTEAEIKYFFVAQALQFKIGIYPYPELVKLFTDFFEDKTTKEQIDEVERHIKATNNRKRVSNTYDKYQERFK